MNGLLYYYSKLMVLLRGKSIRDCHIDNTAHIGCGSNIIRSSFGKYSYCGPDCVISNAEVGNFCSISDHVYIGGEEHPMDWVSTSSVFQNVRHSGSSVRFARHDLPLGKRTIIGSDVWVGHGVTIKQGVSIGHGAVIGSNALVTKDVPAYAVVGGVPAKILKYRFDEATIGLLLNSKWWDKDNDIIIKYSHLIKNPELFANEICKG